MNSSSRSITTTNNNGSGSKKTRGRLSTGSSTRPGFTSQTSSSRLISGTSFRVGEEANTSTSSCDAELPEEFPSLVQQSLRDHVEDKTKHLTLNKLQFSNNKKLYGRDKERALLQNLVFAASHRGAKQLILISGESGTGKTGLAHSIHNSCNNQDGIFVIAGDFGMNSTSSKEAPYMGIAGAIQELCDGILALVVDSTAFPLQLLREKLNSELQDELPLLFLTFPALQHFMGTATSTCISSTKNMCGTHPPQGSVPSPTTGEHKNRLYYAFQRLFQIVTTFLPKRLVIILDNLEWIDEPSLKLMEALLADDTASSATRSSSGDNTGTTTTNKTKKNDLVVIGCYRSDLDQPNSSSNHSQSYYLTHAIIQDWKDHKSSEFGFHMTEIALPNLDMTHVKEWLQDLLLTDDSGVLELAQLCHSKTNGNAFFMVAFLKLLQEKMLLTFDLGTMKWIWDVARIETLAEATDNVAHVMKQSLATCSPQVCELLQIAACLGSSFYEKTLQLVWDDWKTTTATTINKKLSLDDCLSIALEKRLFFRKPDDPTKIIWAHSKVLDAAMALMADDDEDDKSIKSVQSRIGEILVTKLNEVELESAVFIVANLLNEGGASVSSSSSASNPVCNVSHVELAELNLRAAYKATKLAAFETAARYAAKGINCLQQDCWENHYSTTLDLFLTSAEVEGLIGNFESMDSRCNQILSRQDLPDKDKARVYNLQVHRLYLEGRVQEAMDHCLLCLKKLRCSFPKTKLTKGLASVAGLARIKMEAKSRKAEEIESMQYIEDPVKIETMKLLERLISAAYMLKDPLLTPVILRAYRWTLEYGLSENAPANFASIGFIMACFLSDFETGRIFGEYALEMMSQMKSKTMVARVHLVVHGGYLHYVRPLHCTLRALKEGYEVGMQTGSFSPAFQSINLYLQGAFVAGRSLKTLERECRMFAQQMKQLKQDLYVKFLSPAFQTILNLTTPGVAEPTIMTGEAMDEAVLDFPTKAQQALFECHKLQLCLWFGHFEESAKLALSNDPVTKGCPGSFVCYSDNLFRGLSLFQMARTTTKKKNQYTKEAKKMLSLVSKWVEKGNPNIKHHQALLEAEMAALQGKQHIARNKYDIAVVLAGRQGFINDAALANERFGEYMLNDVGDRDDAAYRMKEAINLYKEWGAIAKAEYLQTKYAHLWPIPEHVVTLG
ncbi:Transcriptional regulator [Seminavis robusta]|uniref:Transcriptional regulator n=1 Tax=Seminavis robusta TaxID=568900 RepID=A0A9N8DC54_9STRA|nr:Transcriptional regulator [Seminavis robusta]|eukprot:Sro55_g032340.1 Transcriptional regulator (1181) ;mRNA; f:77596-81227